MKKLMLTLLQVVFVFVITSAQKNQIPLIGAEAPSFTAQSTDGKITFPDNFGDSWKVLFSHPRDFTPVCTSELLELAYMKNDFEKLNVKLAVISTDNITQHKLWKEQLGFDKTIPTKQMLQICLHMFFLVMLNLIGPRYSS